MIRRLVRFGVFLGVVAVVIAVALNKRSTARPENAEPTEPRTPPPDPVPTWVEPTGAVCPTSHPVKAKLSSKIFHLPGMANYERTSPDRCYVDAGAAEADGLRLAKR